MSNEIKGLPPVNNEDLERLDQIEQMKRGISDRLFDLENEKIRVIAAGRKLVEETAAMYARILKERDLSDDSRIEVNWKTGEIRLLSGGLKDQESEPTPDSSLDLPEENPVEG